MSNKTGNSSTNAEIQHEFDTMLKARDYTGLGWFFFNGFMFLKGEQRKLLGRLWDGLSKGEQRRCEQV